MDRNADSNIDNILREIICVRGISALDDGKMLAAIYRDLSNDKKDQRIIQYFTECGGHTALLEAGKLSPSMQKSRFNQTVSKMCAETLVSEEVARQVCNAFWSAVYGSPLEVHSNPPYREEIIQPKEQKITADSQTPEVKYEATLPKKKNHFLGWIIGIAACAALLYLGYIGNAAEPPERKINPEYTALFSKYGFEDHTLDFEEKETLVYRIKSK